MAATPRKALAQPAGAVCEFAARVRGVEGTKAEVKGRASRSSAAAAAKPNPPGDRIVVVVVVVVVGLGVGVGERGGRSVCATGCEGGWWS